MDWVQFQQEYMGAPMPVSVFQESTAIIERLKAAQDPIVGAEVLKDAGAISQEQYSQVLKKTEERMEQISLPAGGTKVNGDILTQRTKDILAGLGAGDDPTQIVTKAAGGALPAGAVTALGALGFSTAAIAALGAGYLATQAIGVQYPWETGPGEGFIAPWSRDIVQDEGGRWVTRETRPDLFGLAAPVGGMGMLAGGAVVGAWTNAAKDGSTPATAEYMRLATGSIAVRSLKTGVISRYRQPRVVGIHSNMRLGAYVKAERMLDQFTRRIAKRTKALKMAK